MHDPKTVAFEIRWPIPRRIKNHPTALGASSLYWDPFITVWHVDPEKGGDDDSCGWGRAKLTDRQMDDLRFLAGCEARSPWITKEKKKEPTSPSDAECLMRATFLMVAQYLRVKLSVAKATEYAIAMTHHPVDNLRSKLCFLPGYHTNTKPATEEDRKREVADLFFCCARIIMRDRRRWWRHPRFHFWHWELQVHPIMHFKRWAFSKCCKCGKGFSWGYSPVTSSWNGKGPQWFKSEENTYHHDCDRPTSDGAASETGTLQ